MKKTILTVLFLPLFLLLPSCGKEETNHTYNQRVWFKINLDHLDVELKTPTNTESFTQARNANEAVGFGGLLVICGPHAVGNSNIYQLYAYDLACPYEKLYNVKIEADNQGYASCKKCGSKYNILEGRGNPVDGPAASKPEEFSLQRYLAAYTASSMGTVFQISYRN